MAEPVSPPEHGAVPIRAGGAPEGFDATLVLREAARGDGPVLHIARDDKRAEAMAERAGGLRPGLPVFCASPAWDCLPYDRVSPNPEVSATRMATLATLAQGFGAPSCSPRSTRRRSACRRATLLRRLLLRDGRRAHRRRAAGLSRADGLRPARPP
jgi:transcription-repair coupling factor (superfamily II helicase)